MYRIKNSFNWLLLPFIGFSFSETSIAQTQPASLKLTGIIRDLYSYNLPAAPPAGILRHPHFNRCNGNGVRGMVQNDLSVDNSPTADTAFGDNRNPLLSPNPDNSNSATCLDGKPERFADWFNDNPLYNRKFKKELTFTLVNGVYQYQNSSFFPLDLNKNPLEFEKFANQPLDPFNDTYPADGTTHNYSFTYELHTQFTYKAGLNQDFNFTGDDDVWVYVNGKLALDLGGLHPPQSSSFRLDNLAATLGLEADKSYPLDFFFAERQCCGSNLKITTSILLVQQPVALRPPTATPSGLSFTSQVAVSLDHVIKSDSLEIHYTTDGSTPDSNSAVYDKTKPFTFSSTTTLKAIAIHKNKSLYLPSSVMTEVYTKAFTNSSIDILDANGNPFSRGFISQLSSSYQIRVTTAQAGLTSVSPTAVTKTAGDNETLSLTTPTTLGDRYVFTGSVPFSIGAAAANAKTEASAYDSLTVRWVNPNDANDVAQAKLYVRPEPKQATASFSADGTTPTSQFAGTETLIYVTITDQILPTTLPAGKAIEVKLTTQPKITSKLADNLTATLTPVVGSPGVYRAAIPVVIDGDAATTTTQLALSSGDQIIATYTDPVDGDVVTTNAGFGAPAVIAGQLFFLDKNGTPWAGGDYSPAEGKLYLKLVDDYAGGTIATKTVSLTIVNKSGQAPADAESVTLTLDAATHVGSQVEWKGSINLRDLPNPVANNSIAETYWRGVVTATVPTHDETGTTQGNVTATLNVAYPDKKSVLVIEDGSTPATPIDRKTPSVIITLNEQSLSSGADTLTADLTCSGSGDQIKGVKLVETAPGSGKYQSVVITKNEGTPANDTVLSCAANDEIKVTYTDPLHPSDKAEVSVRLFDTTPATLLFFDTNGQSIASVYEATDSVFKVRVTGKTPNVGTIDNATVTLKLANGETETVIATETGPATGVFEATVKFKFVSKATPSNGVVEGVLLANTPDNRVNLDGTAVVSGETATNSLPLIGALIPPTSAYITDDNLDGKGDHVYITFPRQLVKVPALVDVYWNAANVAKKTGAGAKISFVKGTNNQVIVIDFSDNPYPVTLSGPGVGPYAKLSDESLFGGRTVTVSDSIGPSILSATKSPADPTKLAAGSTDLTIDTLTVTVSEKLKDPNSRDILLVSANCGDIKDAIPVKTADVPTVKDDGTTLVFKIDNTKSTVLAGQCIYLNPKAVDLAGNPPVPNHQTVGGKDSEKAIQDFLGFPPVTNLDPNSDTWQAAINDTRSEQAGGFALQNGSTYEINWIPPVEFDLILRNKGNATDYDVSKISNGVVDPTKREAMPSASDAAHRVSAVKIVSTTKYKADISIFDTHGVFVKNMKQNFGYNGELNNGARLDKKGYLSFLVWDMKDKNDQLVGQGVYIWKVTFTFDGRKQEVLYVRTGVLRAE